MSLTVGKTALAGGKGGGSADGMRGVVETAGRTTAVGGSGGNADSTAWPRGRGAASFEIGPCKTATFEVANNSATPPCCARRTACTRIIWRLPHWRPKKLRAQHHAPSVDIHQATHAPNLAPLFKLIYQPHPSTPSPLHPKAATSVTEIWTDCGVACKQAKQTQSNAHAVRSNAYAAQ